MFGGVARKGKGELNVSNRSMIFIGAAVISAVAGSVRASDLIIDWNNVLLDAIRTNPGGVGVGGPGAISRTGAIMHAAMFNAVNAVDQTHFSYDPNSTFSPGAAGGADKFAAAAVAANRTLRALYPAALQPIFDARLNSDLASIPDGPAKAAGISLGEYSATHMLALRANDGWDADPSYSFGSNPGDFQMPQAGSPVHPHWGNVTPFGMTSGSQFRTDRIGAYGSMENFLASQEYTDNFNDVKQNGSIDSWTPADDEYKIAFFWANDRNGTSKPPGQLNQITQTMADRQFAGLNASDRLSQSARLFALLNLAMGDAGVAAWDVKYNTPYDLWRPITGIQQADADGNINTISDPSWQPLNHVDPDGPGPMSADPFTPPFPAYVSGHATFGAAHAAIMREFFGDSDSILGGPLTFGTDDPFLPAGYTRTFSSWEDMARENGRSRVYLGVHWQIDADDGYTIGDNLGQWMFDNYLRAVPTPGATMLLAVGAVVGLRRRRA
jgi:hypothetical protein